MPRSRGWCFTINNPTEEDSLVELTKVAQYVIAGKEKGDKEETPHLQGYCYFKNMKSFKQLKKLLPRAHIEAQRGSFEDAIEYCKKEGDWHHEGISPVSKKRQGEMGREFWEEQVNLAKRNRLDQIDPKVLMYHYTTICKLAARYAPMPDDLDHPTGIWYYGPTGTGKSLRARTENPGFYLKQCNKWWDGYINQEVAILEDFDRSHHILGHHLKIWADRYAFGAEVKGSQINIRPKKIIVTSNYHPVEIWPGDPQTLEPIKRRFEIIQMLGENSPTDIPSPLDTAEGGMTCELGCEQVFKIPI